MADLQKADPDVVEELIAAMTSGLRTAGAFTASDGISAALTLAMRMCRSIIELSGDQESKAVNTKRAANVLRGMAAELEMENMDEGKVH